LRNTKNEIGKNLKYLKTTNREIILNLLRASGPLSKTQLARLSNLNIKTISNIINYLIKKNIIKSIGLEKTDAGRKKIHFRINEISGFSVGIDLGASHISVVIINLEGKILEKKIYQYRFGVKGSILLEKIISLTHNILIDSGIDNHKILGLGFTAPGFFNNDEGIWKQSVNILEWESVPIREILKNKFKKDIFLQDSSRSMTLAELWYGEGKLYDNFIFIDIGEGIGMGIILNKMLCEGGNQKSGEIGHIVLDDNGRKCNCGNYGCLETIASGRSIANIIQEKIKSGQKSKIIDLVNNQINDISAIDVVEAASIDDKLSIEILYEAGKNIGKSISYIINIFNPELVVIGGQLSKAGKYLLEPIYSAIERYTLPDLLNDVKITLSAIDQFSAALGVATIAINNKIFNM